MSDPFISRQDLTDYLGRDVTGDDGALIAVDAACDTVRSVTEQDFSLVVGDRVTLDGTGTDTLLLPQLPVVGAGTVTVNGTAVTDYATTADGRLVRVGGTATYATWAAGYANAAYWPEGRRNVVVTYDHGYAGTALPRSVRLVALALASRLVVQGVALQESQGDVSIRYATAATDLTAGEKLILGKYRR